LQNIESAATIPGTAREAVSDGEIKGWQDQQIEEGAVRPGVRKEDEESGRDYCPLPEYSACIVQANLGRARVSSSFDRLARGTSLSLQRCVYFLYDSSKTIGVISPPRR
jgi:hypothetical protein